MVIPHRFVNEARSEDKLLDLDDLLHDYIRLNGGTRLRVIPPEIPLNYLYMYILIQSSRSTHLHMIATKLSVHHH